MRIKLFAVVFLIVISVASSFASEKQYFHYEELVLKIETGRVKSVTIGEHSIVTGVYLEAGVEKEFQCWRPEPANDPLLIRILKENDVEITIAEKEERGFDPGYIISFFYIFVLLIPVISLVLCIIILRKINKLATRPNDITKP